MLFNARIIKSIAFSNFFKSERTPKNTKITKQHIVFHIVFAHFLWKTLIYFTKQNNKNNHKN